MPDLKDNCTKRMNVEYVSKVLLLYDHVLWPLKNAATIMDHVKAFKKYSGFNIYSVNTRQGFPTTLNFMRFPIIILHWSLFGSQNYMLNKRFLKFLAESPAYKIAFFQDEYYFCQQRFNFLNQYDVKCVYTLLDLKYIPQVYGKYTKVKTVTPTLTGYVSDNLVKKAARFSKPDSERTIDIGYRVRALPFYMGKGAREKYDVAIGFKDRLDSPAMVIDIETSESKRLYGDDWFKFLGNCKACLGAMAGVSIFDVDGTIQAACTRLLKDKPDMTFDEISEQFLSRFENNIPNRVVSPRLFEAAAFRICQILFEGDYQGILKPMVHYIPLKKDFSNFDEVLQLLKNKAFCKTLTDNCYRDLIESEKYNYQGFIRSFDQELITVGFIPASSPGKSLLISGSLFWDAQVRVFIAYWSLFMRLAAYGNLLISHVRAVALGIYWNRVSPHVWRIRKRLFNLPDKGSGSK